MVADLPIVKLLGREGADLRMHSKLYRQHRLVEATIEQPLEQAPTVASVFGIAGEGRRR